jgi:hypothetical protein
MTHSIGRRVSAGVCSVLLAGVVAGQQAEAGPPVAGVYSRTFNSPTTLNGLVVIGRVSFYSATGGVKFAYLAKDQVAWGKTPLPKGTGIHFTRDGEPNWCFLAKHSEVKGHLLHGGGQDWMTCFYPSGELKSGGLVNTETIDGIPCDVGSFWNEAFGGGGRTYWYEDGRLKSAKVAKTITYRGQTIKKGRRVALNPDGTIKSIK